MASNFKYNDYAESDAVKKKREEVLHLLPFYAIIRSRGD
jgi:hypothetical protein